MFTIKLESKELNDTVTRALEIAPKEAHLALRSSLLDLATRSALQAPIETGDLRNDCRATLNGRRIFIKQKSVLSGDTGTKKPMQAGSVYYSLPYANRQHEDLTLNHNRTDGYLRKNGTSVNMVAGGNAKFLERPFNQRLPTYEARFDKSIDKALGAKGDGQE